MIYVSICILSGDDDLDDNLRTAGVGSEFCLLVLASFVFLLTVYYYTKWVNISIYLHVNTFSFLIVLQRSCDHQH